VKWGKSAAAEDEWLIVGAATAGTEAAVDALNGGHATGLGSADPAFNPSAFATWSATVFERAVTAWRTGSPEPLHPVMEDHVWEHYAQWLLFLRGLPLARNIMATARATPELLGAVAEAGYHSALVEFQVQTQAPQSVVMDPSWHERWLFQRPASCRTNASGAVAVCPVCGAPAEPEETGRCRYCHADITTRTAGWLVTRTATTMKGAKLAERIYGSRAPSGAPSTAAGPIQPPRAGPIQPPRAGPA
jgi:hypothetical protein